MTRILSVWPPPPAAAWLRAPRTELPFPLGRDDCRLYRRARHGIWHGVRALGLGAGDAVLVPAYHHGSEVEAFVRAGLEPRFYDVAHDLEPDEAELDSLLDDHVRALHLVHYLGFASDAARWRSWCDRHGLLLIEDAAQAWLACVGERPVGSLGDLAVYSLYKTFGLPDGAAARAVVGLPQPRQASGGFAAIGRQHVAALARAFGAMREGGAYSPAADFALGDVDAGIAPATAALLARVADPSAAASRRANFEALCAALEEHVPEPFRRKAHGASPFVFPVVSDSKPDLLAALRRAGIVALDVWRVPHPSLDAGAFPAASELRRDLVGLPVHQDLGARDLERIVHALRPARRRSAQPSLEPLRSLDDLAGEWDDLALRSGNLFATREWLQTWAKQFGGSRLLLHACRGRDGRLVALLPLYERRIGPLRLWRFLGHDAGDELGPISLPDDRPAAARALARLLAARRPDVFLGEQLRAELNWTGVLGARVLRREASPVLPFSGRSADELMATWSSNLRGQARRLPRRLAARHAVRYRLVDEPAGLGEGMDALFALHRARWRGSQTAFAAREAFHREFAAVALEREWLRLWLLEVDGRPAAAWYGFRFAGAELYYQFGRDPDFDHLSVGFVLLVHTILAALEDGCVEYRFLRGDEDFKFRFATEDPGLETVVVGATARGRAAVAVAARADGARRRLRAWL